MSVRSKVLKNALLNTGGNRLKIADIFYDRTIKEIRSRPGTKEFDWQTIDSKEKKETFIAALPEADLPSGVEICDAHYLLVMPGAIDPHVHFNTPGYEFRDDFEHGSTAAAYGGVTTVIDMPCTSIPEVTSLAGLLQKVEALQKRSLIDFALWGGISANHFDKLSSNVKELSAAGVAGFKAYVLSGMKSFGDLSYKQIRLAAQKIRLTGKPLALHAEDKTLVLNEKNRLQAQNANSWQDYCTARSSQAEALAVEKLMYIARDTGCRIHIVHLSSAAGLQPVIAAQKEGLPFTAETCPHYLYFTQEDFKNPKIRNFLKTAPPVKHSADRQALWRALARGEIRFVTTDHAGCDPQKEKISDNFWQVYGGIPGVEHRVPFLFSEGFKKGRLTLQQTIDLLSTHAADFFRLKHKGKLSPGMDADMALIDLWSRETVQSTRMHSKGQYTPFEGVTFSASVARTILHGKVIMGENNEAEVSIGYGKFLTVGE